MSSGPGGQGGVHGLIDLPGLPEAHGPQHRDSGRQL
jgi:hypothetical protein